MTSNTNLQVTDLDFEQIKSNIKSYLKGKNEFADYDFEGSTLDTLIDVLAYNTYQNSYYMNMTMNEMFLDSARKRNNVVSRAKQLGYIPRSATSSKATITVSFSPNDSPDEIIIPKYKKFTTTIDRTAYTFVTAQEYSVLNSSGVYTKTIDIYEGVVVTDTFTYNSSNPTDIILENENIDLTSLEVNVYENSSTTTKQLYTRFEDLTDVTSTSNVYFVDEHFSGYYKIYFGDDILGKALENGNVVEIIYRVCETTAPNGAQNFTAVGYSGYNAAITTTQYEVETISLVTAATYGDEKESIDSIKFYAPKLYEAQNRAVTKKDYQTFILNNFSYVQSVNVWGGEDHDPPIYGKVIVSIKPFFGFFITQDRKDDIFSFLEDKNVLSIEPIIIDPTFVYIRPNITAYYDSSTTSLTAEGILSQVSNAVSDFETNKLGVFDSQFKYSRFVASIDSADAAIVSNETDILLEKRTNPVYNSIITYKIKFDAQLYRPYEGYIGTISSSKFKLTNYTNDLYLDDDGNGNVRLYYLNATNDKVYVNRAAGTVDYDTGDVRLQDFSFESITGLELQIFAKPSSKNYTATRNQIILLSYPTVNVFDTRLNRVTQSGVLDTQGNLSYQYSNNIDVPTIV